MKLAKKSKTTNKQLALERCRRGVNVIAKSEKLHKTDVTNYEIKLFADSLLGVVSDYFDRMLIATAKAYNATLLTEDSKLTSIPREHRLFSNLKVLSWSKI